MNRYLMRRKVTACLLVMVMLFSFAGGLGTFPGAVGAQDEVVAGDFLLNVGNYRGLSQEPSVPISVRNAEELVALEFIVVSSNNYNIDVAVKSVERGADLPGGASITWSGVGHGDVRIGIFMHEAGFSGDGELVRIRFEHDASEQTYNQPIYLEVNPADVTARVVDGEFEEGQIFGDDSVELNITSGSISNGEIRVAIMFGDMDKNESVTVNDALLALRASVGDLELTPQLIDAGDVKRAPGDTAATVTVYDALLIAKKAVGLIDFFPVAPDPDAGPDPGEQTMFTIAPSAILIGDHELTSARANIGGEVTFTVRFPSRIVGDVKLEVTGAAGIPVTNTEFINGNEVDITVEVTGTGERVVSAYQYNTITREKGVSLDRFVRIVDTEDTPLPVITATRNTQLDFGWDATNAARKITIRQSIDGSAWTDARVANPIGTTDTTATVTNLDPNRGYYFKLKVDGGVHAGESKVLRFNRMTGDTVSERLGHLYVDILYTGQIKQLNTTLEGNFKMFDENGQYVKDADRISAYGTKGIRVTFFNETAQNFTLRYDGPIRTLDRDLPDRLSYMMSPDEVIVGDYAAVTEITVSTLVELDEALANSSVERIFIGGNITGNINISQPNQVIDGDSFTLTGNVTVDAAATGVTMRDLNIGGNLTVNGANFTGQALTVTGTTTLNAANASFNTTFEGDVVVNAAATGARFTNVRFMQNLLLDQDVTFGDVVTTNTVTLGSNRAVYFRDNDTLWALGDDVSLSSFDLTLDGAAATMEGNGNSIVGPGEIIFNEEGLTAEDVVFETDVVVSQDATFKEVKYDDMVTVTVATGRTLILEGDIEVTSGNTVTFVGPGSLVGDNGTFKGAGDVEFDTASMAAVSDLTFEVPVVVSIANTFGSVTFADDVTVDAATTFLGGGWTAAAEVTVTTNSALTFQASGGRVANAGNLKILSTAVVDFNTSMSADLQNAIGVTSVTFENVSTATPAAFALGFTLSNMTLGNNAELEINMGDSIEITSAGIQLLQGGIAVPTNEANVAVTNTGTLDTADVQIQVSGAAIGLPAGAYNIHIPAGIRATTSAGITVPANVTVGGIRYDFNYNIVSP